MNLSSVLWEWFDIAWSIDHPASGFLLTVSVSLVPKHPAMLHINSRLPNLYVLILKNISRSRSNQSILVKGIRTLIYRGKIIKAVPVRKVFLYL